MKRQIRCALWDMDGVLVDTGDFHFQAWKKVLGELNIPFDLAIFKATFGMNNFGVLSTLLGRLPQPQELAEIDQRKEGLFRELIHGQAQPLPGVLEWLQFFHQAGVPQAVCSSAPRDNIDLLVQELNLSAYFDRLISGPEHGLPGKPDPAVFLAGARQLGHTPQECVVIEDAVAGVAAAKAGGMFCIAVTTTNPANALTQADLILPSLADLPPERFMA